MRLSDIAFTSFMFNSFTDFNKSYKDLLSKTCGSPDLTNEDHIKALLIWLNKWKCRQFSRDCHDSTIKRIKSWYIENQDKLPDSKKEIFMLTEKDLDLIRQLFDSLSVLEASVKIRNRIELSITVGPTGASKILFALRPKSLIPLDSYMRKYFGLNSNGNSYIRYIKLVISLLKELEIQCNDLGYELIDVPKIIGRPEFTLPKLIDEYHWVTITNNCVLPVTETFKKWLDWSLTKD